MVIFNDVSFGYEETILEHLSFHIEPKSFTAIIGPSGCGKSTIFSLIAGYYMQNQGTITINPCCESPGKIGFMMQNDHLLEWRTIESNILLGLELQHKMSADAKLKAKAYLRKYGLEKYANKKPSQLSGGMRQRISLIRTLMLDPELLLLDEPFSALDYQTRLHVSKDIYEMIHAEQKTAILVTHDIAEAVAMSDTVLVLSSKPCHIVKTLSINFEKQGITQNTIRNTPEFQIYFDKIWEALQNGSQN